MSEILATDAPFFIIIGVAKKEAKRQTRRHIVLLLTPTKYLKLITKTALV